MMTLKVDVDTFHSNLKLSTGLLRLHPATQCRSYDEKVSVTPSCYQRRFNKQKLYEDNRCAYQAAAQ